MASDTGMNLYGVSGATREKAEFSTVKGSGCILKAFGSYKGEPLVRRSYEFQVRGDDLKVNVGINNGNVLTFTFRGAKKYQLRSLGELHQSFTAAMEHLGFKDMLEEDSTFFTDLQDQFGSLSREEKKVPSPALVPPMTDPTVSTDLSMYMHANDETLSSDDLEKAIQSEQLELEAARSDAKEAEEEQKKAIFKRERLIKLALLRKAKKEAEDRKVRALGNANSFAAKASAASEAYPPLSSARVGKAPLDKPLTTRVAKKGGAGSNAFAALATEDDGDDSDAEE